MNDAWTQGNIMATVSSAGASTVRIPEGWTDVGQGKFERKTPEGDTLRFEVSWPNSRILRSGTELGIYEAHEAGSD